MSDQNSIGTHVGVLLTPELIKAISLLFPRKPLNINVSEKQLWLEEGRCTVVEVLQAKYDEVNRTIQPVLSTISET